MAKLLWHQRLHAHTWFCGTPHLTKMGKAIHTVMFCSRSPQHKNVCFFKFFYCSLILHLTVYAQRMMYVLSLCPISCMHEVNLYSGNRASGTLLLCHVDPLLSTIPYSFSYRNKYIQPLPIPNLNSLLVLLHLTFLCTHHLHWHSRLA